MLHNQNVMPTVLLVENFESNTDEILLTLEYLEKLKIVSVRDETSKEVEFNPDRNGLEAVPELMVMYLDNYRTHRVFFMENAYLILMESFLGSMETIENNCLVKPAGKESAVDLVGFMSKVFSMKLNVAAVEN